ncbi:MAG: glycosyltransferase [Butyrivibrio sp.]|nr:glycosyltransferase [Butyrivibrio sp.]
MASLKQGIKQLLVNKQHKRYQKEVVEKNLTYYDAWIRAQEEKLNAASLIARIREKKQETAEEPFTQLEITDRNGKGRIYTIISADVFEENKEAVLKKYISDIIIFKMYDGKINDIALPLIDEKFRENSGIVLAYGDEDALNGEVRENPWLKPDWSPDNFLDMLYFGGLIAVRTEELAQSALRNGDYDLYMLLFDMIRDSGGFDKWNARPCVPVCHIQQVLFNCKENAFQKLPAEAADKLHTTTHTPKSGEDVVSVVIPSKDNPDTLFKCVESLLDKTKTDYIFEIILIDNGSSEENKGKIEAWTERLNNTAKSMNDGFSGCRYIYKPMQFNFSLMCNMGAEESKGELLLFLNDDMEIIQADWLDMLAGKATLPYAGAVGAKLLYPDSHIIQHAGITNLRVGPAHKLQFLDDEEIHYFGKNRGVHNVLAVTGACLMVRKEVFWQAGGFPEELAVAFNDVDLCYSIYENGYYNIVRNDVVLYHHESLSRGHDGESEEKQIRLMKEKDVLYERHRELYGKDPFYHKYLTTDRLDAGYTLDYRYHMLEDMAWSKVKDAAKSVESAREDKCLVVGMECAMDIYKWKYGVSRQKGKIAAKPQDMGYFFQGYSFVIGADNACYRKELLLQNKHTGAICSVPVENVYREDIRNNLQDQLNVGLTGFSAKIPEGSLIEGTYRFGMLAQDLCSRQRLVNWSNWVLEVK